MTAWLSWRTDPRTPPRLWKRPTHCTPLMLPLARSAGTPVPVPWPCALTNSQRAWFLIPVLSAWPAPPHPQFHPPFPCLCAWDRPSAVCRQAVPAQLVSNMVVSTCRRHSAPGMYFYWQWGSPPSVCAVPPLDAWYRTARQSWHYPHCHAPGCAGLAQLTSQACTGHGAWRWQAGVGMTGHPDTLQPAAASSPFSVCRP